jgi:hypothetical protein
LKGITFAAGNGYCKYSRNHNILLRFNAKLVIKMQERKVYFSGDNMAFGIEGHFYKWIMPFIAGRTDWHFEEVGEEEYTANIDKKIITMTTDEINDLVKKRDAILEIDYESKEADEIATQIITAFKSWMFGTYPCDFIIETLTKFGLAPKIVYDDNGLFAVTDTGYQTVVTGDEKMDGQITVFCTPDIWEKTIREAIHNYLNR